MKKIRIYTICTSSFLEEVHIDLFAKNYDLSTIEIWNNKIRGGNIPARELYTGKIYEDYNKIVETFKYYYRVLIEAGAIEIEHYIISAGAGIIRDDTCIRPYEASFAIESGENRVDSRHFEELLCLNPHSWGGGKYDEIFNIFILSKPYRDVLAPILKREMKKSELANSLLITASSTKGIEGMRHITYDTRARKVLKTGDSGLIGKFPLYFLKQIFLKYGCYLRPFLLFEDFEKIKELFHTGSISHIKRDKISKDQVLDILKKNGQIKSWSGLVSYLRKEGYAISTVNAKDLYNSYSLKTK